MIKLCLFVLGATVAFGKHIPPCEQVDKFNDVIITMFQEKMKTNAENLVLSATSIAELLALISLGARGETSKQLKDVLNLFGSDRDIKNWFRGVTLELKTARNLTIGIANKAYLAECVALNADFVNLAKDYFDAGVENINFYDPEQAALEINNWVLQKTDNKINNLICEDNINALTRLILVSTLYFSGEFMYPFPISATQKADFHISKTESVKVDMMTISGYHLISKHPDLGASMVYIPFKNQRAKIVFIIPDDVEKAEDVLSNVITVWHNRNFSQSFVRIFLPRFKVDSTLLMRSVLETIGITRLFSKPDLSGISRDEIVPSEVFQRSFIDVNEVGVNTGDVSTVSAEDVRLTLPGHKIKPHLFKVDRPFVYGVLYDGLVLTGGIIRKV